MSGDRFDRVVGLDLSLTSTGVASLRRDDPRVVVGDVITSSGRTADTLWERAQRIKRITRSTELLTRLTRTLVVVEMPAYSRTGGANVDRMGLWWSVVARAAEYAADTGGLVAQVSTSSLAKWATGSGAPAGKKARTAAAIARLCPDLDISTDDVSDAAALALLGAHHLGWRPDLDTAFRADALAKITWPEEL